MGRRGFIARCIALAVLASLATGVARGQHNEAYVGDIWCSDGKFYTPEAYAQAGSDVKAKGVVYWVDPEGKANANRMVALKDAAQNVGWSGSDNTNDDIPKDFEVAFDSKKVDGQHAIHGMMCSPWRGKENTEALRKLIAEGKEYPAVAAISDEEFNAGWFLPSIAELMMLAAQYRFVAVALATVKEKEGTAEGMRMQMYYSSSIDAENKGVLYLAGSGGVRADTQNDRRYANNMGARAVRAFSAKPAAAGGKKIGDLIDFGDGSKGVLVHVARDGQSGWAVGLKDVETKQSWAVGKDDKTKALNVSIVKKQEAHKDVNTKWNELGTPSHRSMDVLLPVLMSDDGHANTVAIRKAGTKDEYPAAYATDFDKGWYLPAAGQMQMLYSLEPFIKKTLETNGGAAPEGYYWTSTPEGSQGAWYLSAQCGIFDYPNDEGMKIKKYRVRAMRNWQQAAPAPPATFTLIFDGNRPSYGKMGRKTIAVGDIVCIPEFGFNSKDKQGLLGWSRDKAAKAAEFTSGQCVVLKGKKDETITLYAVWKPETYKVVFNGNGGSGLMKALQVNVSESVTLPANGFTYADHTFLGWSKDKTATKPQFTAGQSVDLGGKKDDKITLYAVWKANGSPSSDTYTLAFDGNGATSGAMGNVTVEVGKPIDLPKNAFARENHTFLGWSKDRAATVAEYANEAKGVTLNGKKGETLTLFAVWKADPDGLTAVASELLAGIQVLTNPFGSRLTLLHTQAAEKIEVFSATGQRLFSQTPRGAEQLDIATDGWSNGVYIVRIIAQDGEKILRVVRQ